MSGDVGPGSGLCPRCEGVGFRYETRDGREWATPCACRGGQGADDPIEACRIPGRLRGLTLGSFVPKTTPERQAYERALAYCARFPQAASEKGLGLLFSGPRGTGKSHLAVGVLRELVASHGLSGRFWDFDLLVKEIARSYDKSTLTTTLDTLGSALTVDVLLLDDLASRRIPDWAHNTLFEIVDARYRARLPTLITTVFEDADRDLAKDAGLLRRDEFLIDRIGRPVRSRLLEMCLFVSTRPVLPRPAPDKRPRTLAAMRRRG